MHILCLYNNVTYCVIFIKKIYETFSQSILHGVRAEKDPAQKKFIIAVFIPNLDQEAKTKSENQSLPEINPCRKRYVRFRDRRNKTQNRILTVED